MGFGGDERSTRRVVAEAKQSYAAGHRRTYRPWVPEPGMWTQYDWGQGPEVRGRGTCLFCAWLAWSRFRVVIPTWDRTLATTLACIDVMLRRFGAARPTSQPTEASSPTIHFLQSCLSPTTCRGVAWRRLPRWGPASASV
jgi:hypothetical protein